MIELGMAHSLGRPTRIVQKIAAKDYRPPKIGNLEKIEILGYRDFAALKSLTREWVENLNK